MTNNSGNIVLSTQIKESGHIRFCLDKTIYEKEAILTTAYALSKWCTSYIESGTDSFFDVLLEPLPEHNCLDINELKQRFLNELTDQQLRLDLEKRYGPLRILIVRQAFSPLENLEAEVKRIVGRG